MAAEIAEALGADLDFLVVRKLGAPLNPEFAVGAVGEDGVVVIDDAIRRELAITERELQTMVAAARSQVEQRSAMLRWAHAHTPISDRVVIVIDDGLATGSTALAAVAVLRARAPERIVVAVPTGSTEALRKLRAAADEVVCLESPAHFGSVGAQYNAFPQVSDEDVIVALRGHDGAASQRDVRIPIGNGVTLEARLGVPPRARGLVIFAHGSGSSRLSSRNIEVADHLQRAGIATLLMDLLTESESMYRQNVFDVDLLAQRLRSARDWARRHRDVCDLPIGYFGASTGAAAALAAAQGDPQIAAVVCRGGRPDLAGERVRGVSAPTLFIVGGDDTTVLALNRQALARMECQTALEVVPSARHLFEEPGALEAVEECATSWFAIQFAQAAQSTSREWEAQQHVSA